MLGIDSGVEAGHDRTSTGDSEVLPHFIGTDSTDSRRDAENLLGLEIREGERAPCIRAGDHVIGAFDQVSVQLLPRLQPSDLLVSGIELLRNPAAKRRAWADLKLLARMALGKDIR